MTLVFAIVFTTLQGVEYHKQDSQLRMEYTDQYSTSVPVSMGSTLLSGLHLSR